MNENEQAAQTAAVMKETPGLVLFLSKKDSDRLDAATAVAEKEAATFSKNIGDIVGKLNVLKTIVEQVQSIVSSNVENAAKVTKIQSLVSAGGNEYKLEEARAEEKPGLNDTIQETTRAVSKAGMSVLGLAMAIPLLLANPEILNLVKGFFEGFLTGIGLSNDAIAIVKPAIAVLLGILAVSFTMAALAPVVTAFESLRKLAMVLGLAGTAAGDAHDEVKKKDKDVKQKEKDVRKEQAKIDKEKEDIKKGTDTAKEEVKKGKDEIKKAKKAGSKSKTKIGKFLDKTRYLIDKVKPKLVSMAGNILKSIPIVGTILGIGLVLYQLYDLGSDIYDVYFGNDEEKPESETKPPANTTTLVPASETTATATAKATPSGTAPASPPSAAPTSTPVSAPSPPSATTSSSVAEPVAPASSGVTPMVSASASEVITQSVKVDQMERDATQSFGTMLLNINNNQFIVGAKEMARSASDSFYSVSVGA